MRLLNESKGVYDAAIEAKRQPRKLDDGSMTLLDAEESVKVARMDERIAEIEAEVGAMDDRERRERESATARDAFERQYGPSGAERKERSEAEQFRAWVAGHERRSNADDFEKPGSNSWSVNLRGAARERELIRQGYQGEELRSLLWDTGSVASAVPTMMSRTLYQYLEASIAALRMPTTRLTTDSGAPMDFPKVAAHGIATQVIAQGTAIGGTDPTFAKMTLDAFKYGQLTQLASEVIQDTGIDIVGFVGGNIGRAVGRRVNQALVAGDGSGAPNGMVTVGWTGANGTVATGGSLLTPSYENLVDLVYSVADEYRASGNAAWLMRDATAGNIRKLRDGAGGTTGSPLWQPSLTSGISGQGQPDTLLTYPVYTDPNVASLASNAKTVFFGDWNAYYVRLVGDLVIERSDDFAFDTDLVTFRGKQRVDGDSIDDTAVNLLKQSVS